MIWVLLKYLQRKWIWIFKLSTWITFLIICSEIKLQLDFLQFKLELWLELGKLRFLRMEKLEERKEKLANLKRSYKDLVESEREDHYLNPSSLVGSFWSKDDLYSWLSEHE
jgi:hypothetical protein